MDHNLRHGPSDMTDITGKGLLRISGTHLPLVSEEGPGPCNLQATSSQSNIQISIAEVQQDVGKAEHIARRKNIGPIPLDCRTYKENVRYIVDENMSCSITDATNFGGRVGACGKPRGCQCCELWSTEPQQIKASYNGKTVKCALNRDATCLTKNLVYVLSCPECNICYVGETKQELRKRLYQHCRNIRKDLNSTHLVRHFHSAHGRVVTPEVRVLQTMPEDGSDKDRKDAEARWTLALNTAFPWGLNVNVKGCGAITSDTDPAERRNCPWFRVKYQRPIPRGYQQLKKKKPLADRINSHQTSCEALDSYGSLGRDLLSKYRRLSQMKPSELGRLVDLARIRSQDDLEWYVYQELASFQLAHHSKEKPLIEKPKYIPFDYVNRHSDLLQPDRLLRTRSIYPDGVTKGSLPRVIFTKAFVRPIGTYVNNYNQFLRRQDVRSLQEAESRSCFCHTAAMRRFVNPDLGHVCTGDLAVVSDHLLANVLDKGSTYRLTESDSVEDAYNTCQHALMMFVHNIVYKSLGAEIAGKIYAAALGEMNAIAAKCEARSAHQAPEDHQRLDKVLPKIRALKRRFVIAPVDKAANNFAFICPKLYLQIMNTELGVVSSGQGIDMRGNKVYRLATENEAQIVQLHAEATLKYTGKELSEANKVTPTLWASPKFHKKPIKFRFIAGASRASTKELSVKLATILVHFKSHWERYTTRVTESKGYSCCWPIDNSNQVAQLLRRQKLPNNSKLQIADFSTLYTAFEHDIILDKTSKMIKLLFKHSGHKYLTVGYKAYYHSSEAREGNIFTLEMVLDLLELLVRNSYVTYAGKLFHQISGIPMGANYSPVLANLCLAYMEFEYLIANPAMGRRLNFTVRYIDDLLSIGSDALREAAPHMYPATLPLSFDDTSEGTGHYLDLAINRNTKTISLFDKRKDFNFDVIRFTNADSNVPRGLGLNILYSQAVRLARICSGALDFHSHLKELVRLMKSKNFADIELIRTLNTVRTRYPCLFVRHKINSKRDVQRLVVV